MLFGIRRNTPLGSGPKAIVVVYDIFGLTTQAKQVRWRHSTMLHDICTIRAFRGHFSNVSRVEITLFQRVRMLTRQFSALLLRAVLVYFFRLFLSAT